MSVKLDLGSFREAVSSLEAAIKIVNNPEWFNSQSIPMQNILRAGIVQNFEFVYEISIKMIRRQLQIDAASPSEIDFTDFKDLIRTAGEKGLVKNVAAWFNYRNMRNITSHTYDQKKAIFVYQSTLSFIDDANNLLQRLESRNG